MTQEKKHSLWYHLFDVGLNIVIILGIVTLIRVFLVSPFQVEGDSMLDTLHSREYILINKLAYHLGSPDRGDVVVLRPPTNPDKHYVKRVIGIPGDTVVLRNGKVYITPEGSEEEIELLEPYLNERNQGNTYPTQKYDSDVGIYDVPEEYYFVMGDNRRGSADSRGFDATETTPRYFVPEDAIKGRVWWVLLPIKRVHAMELPMYGF